VRFTAILLIVVSGLIFGCAHSLDKFYHLDGTVCAKISSFVIGTGEAEKYVVSPCGTVMYDTKDTGISKNATELGGKVAEGAVKGLVPAP
jgi:hypothetical protein